MRRVIKAFAVEIRGSGRRTRVSEPKAPMWPELADQPAVWPEAFLLPTAKPEAADQAEQAVMVQAAVPAPWPFEPYQDPRKPPPARAIVLDATAPEMQPERPKGRVLLAIEEPKPVKVETAEEIVTARPPTVRAKRTKPVSISQQLKVAQPISVEIRITPEAAVAPLATVDVRPSRRGAVRLARDDFERGERWKARLPAAVHRR